MDPEDRIGANGRTFHLSLPNTTAGAAHARKQFMRFIECFQLRARIVGDIEAVVGEALANAAEHGYRNHGTIRVDASVTEDDLEASISDDGPGFLLKGPISVDHPPAHSPRGYGLFLIRTLVDELEFRNNGKTVWFKKRFNPVEKDVQ